jgi:MFS family permease
LSFFGALIGTVGLFFLSGFLGVGLHENMRITSVISMLSLVGVGLGLFQSPNNNAIMGCVPEQKLGTASAILATVRNLGLVVGTGFSTGFFTWYRERSGDFTAALHTTHLVAAVIGVLATLSAFAKESKMRERS